VQTNFFLKIIYLSIYLFTFAGSLWRDLCETMSDVAIALVVIIVVAVVTVVIAVLIRLYGIYHLTSCFASSEEKAVLTQHEQYNGYMVRSLALESNPLTICKYLKSVPIFLDVPSRFWSNQLMLNWFFVILDMPEVSLTSKAIFFKFVYTRFCIFEDVYKITTRKQTL
jgi:hypothetical protein